MFKIIKQFFSNISFKIIADFIKDTVVYSLPFIVTYGGNMITDNTISWFLILIGYLIGIYLLKNSIKKNNQKLF